MSSSTVSNPYITESWIHMEQHRFTDKEGKYTKSTASSRSRALLNKETDMSQTAYESAFAEADKPPTRKYNNDTRRKSTTSTVDLKRPVIKDPNRLKANLTEKLNTRRQTLSGALMTTKEDENNGLVKLADRLRNTLAIERQLAKEELAIYNKPHLDETPLTRRRTSVVKDKLRTEDTPRRRTLSNGASILPQPQRAPESNYMKTTKAADQQRRHSTANTTVNRLSSASPRKTSNLSRGDTTSPSITSEDEKPNSALKRRTILAAATVKARQQLDLANSSSSSDEPTVTRLRKKSIVNENPIDSILANRRMSRTENLKDGLPTSPTIAARMARRKSTANSPSEEQTAARLARRKSTVKNDSPSNSDHPTMAAARMARRKSVVNSPNADQSLAARMARRKSVIKNESPNGDQPSLTTTRRKSIVKTEEAEKKPTVRKRGKTLPGSLAKPPTVQSLQLPPMKLEPIKLNIPQQKRLAPKSPSVKAMSTTSTSRLSLKTKKRLSISSSSANTTPIPISSSSSSSAEAPTTIVTPPKKSISTRKAKGQSHLGISTSRRPSLKTPTSAQVVTPPLKNSPVTIPSPRVRPTPTRRSSLAVPSTKKTPVSDDRKLSVSGYSNSSRKNSVEETVEKDKGNLIDRYLFIITSNEFFLF